MMRHRTPHGRKLLLTLAIASVQLCTGCVSRLFYYPDRVVYQTPAKFGLRYRAATFRSRDGTRLRGWFVPAVGEAAGTVMHFHGNAQNMSAHFDFVRWLPERGFNVFVFDYRGYGGSEGAPERAGMVEDCAAAVEYVKSRADVDPDKLLVFGQSLGGALAVAALSEHGLKGIRAVAIESTFYSYRAIVRDKLGEVPVLSVLKWPLSFLLISDAHSPSKGIDALSPTALLLVHGTADRVIPHRHSQRLFGRAKLPKQLWLIEGAGHTEGLTMPEYREKLIRFFRDALQ